MSGRDTLKQFVFVLATLAVLPALASYRVRAALMGRDRALEGSSQLLALVPGVLGQYMRRAFLHRTLASCHPSVTVEFGTIFSQADARIDESVYIGPHCHVGLVHLERDVLIAGGVHLPSGPNTHGTADPRIAIRLQPGERALVRVGEGAWVGSAAVVMADVGAGTVVGAGSVVTRPLPSFVIAAGAPAKAIKPREGIERHTA